MTVGQRRGLGLGPDRRYVLSVDSSTATVTVGPLDALMVSEIALGAPVWVEGPPFAGEALEAQMSAHGQPVPARWSGRSVLLDVPVRKVAPGQSVVLYRSDDVVGGGVVLQVLAP